MKRTLSIMRTLKERRPGVVTVFGGHLATMCGMQILAEQPDLDFVIEGDGEASLPALLDCSAAAIPTQCRACSGARRAGSPARSRRRPLFEIDALPGPARDGLDFLAQLAL